MANLRTQIAIPAGQWTKIIDGKTSARVFEKKTISSGYMTVEYDSNTDNPNTIPVSLDPDADTVEGMFFNNKDWIYENPVLGYVWAAPVGDVDGILVVTS